VPEIETDEEDDHEGGREDGEDEADETVLKTWLDALDAAGAGDHGNIEDDDDDDADHDLAAILAGEDDNDDDPPERRPATLQQLPTDNNPNYRQEDKRYLAFKKYVRSGKLPLAWMLDNDVKIPTMLSVLSVYGRSSP
jgi:hypothetical protein